MWKKQSWYPVSSKLANYLLEKLKTLWSFSKPETIDIGSYSLQLWITVNSFMFDLSELCVYGLASYRNNVKIQWSSCQFWWRVDYMKPHGNRRRKSSGGFRHKTALIFEIFKFLMCTCSPAVYVLLDTFQSVLHYCQCDTYYVLSDRYILISN